MPTSIQYSAYAQAALAAYAPDLAPGADNTDQYADPEMMSVTQAAQFNTTWNVLQQSTPNGDGFSAVLLQNRMTGEKVLSIAGTDPSSREDWFADALIALFGTVVGMSQYTSLDLFYQQLVSTGKLGAGEQVVVAGHSLGGFLAQAFTARHANVVSAAYTYNAPGFGSVETMLGFFGVTDTSAATKITNVHAIDGDSVVAGLGTLLGASHSVRIEPGALAWENHSIVKLGDALAVHELHGRLQPTLSASQIEAQFLAAGYRDSRLEDALDGLRTVFIGSASNDANKTPTGNRDSFYANLYSLKNDGGFIALSGQVQLVEASAGFGSLAQATNAAAQAYRYALLEFLPFAVVASTDAQNQTLYGNYALRLSLYNDGTGTGELTKQWLVDRADMLRLIVARNRLNEDALSLPGAQGMHYKDVASGTEFDIGLPDGIVEKRQIQFGGDAIDTLSGKKLEDHLYGGGGNDTLNGLGGADYLEGNAGGDALDGGDGNDELLGGSGDDSLTGGTGNDILSGGLGTDTYVVGANGGVNVAMSSDAADRLQFVGRTLVGAGTFKAGTGGVTVWVDETVPTANITYMFDANRAELTVAGSGTTVVVRDFQSGDLGIAAPSAPVLPPPTPAYVFDLGTAGGRSAWSLSSSLPQTANFRVVNANDTDPAHWVSIMTAAGNDVIAGGAGITANQTFLSGGAGNDQIFSGAEVSLATAIAQGETQLATGRGVFMLAGGDGKDLLVGGANDDVIFGGADSDTIVAGAGGDIVFADGDSTGALRVDVPVGAPSWVIGSNDIAADDPRRFNIALLIARLGVTVSGSQGGAQAVFQSLSAELNPLSDMDLAGLLAMQRANVHPDAGDTRTYQANSQLSYSELHAGVAFATNAGWGNDVVYAGAGDDVVNAGAGDDVVYGGAGNDMVAGYDGDDVLEGGDGDDRLEGDYAVAVANGAAAVETLPYFGAQGEVRATLDVSRHGRDFINGGSGNDVLLGGGSNDVLFGGAGGDTLYGDHVRLDSASAGDDYLEGEEGDDTLVGGGGSDMLDGGDGTDTLLGDDDASDVSAQWHGSDYLYGGAGNDYLYGGGGDDVLSGGDGNDWIAGEDETATNLVSTLTGNDTLDGGDGQDTLIGGNGADLIDGGTEGDLLFGSAGDDTLMGGDGNDRLEGGAGNNVLWGDAGPDVLLGGTGSDQLNGGDGNDIIFDQTSPNDSLAAQDLDTIDGGNGDDTITVYGGTDTVRGGNGNDAIYMFGGGGLPKIVFGAADGNDTVVNQTGTTLGVSFDLGFSPSDAAISFNVANGALAFTLADGNSLSINQLLGANYARNCSLVQMHFADGTKWTYDGYSATLVDVLKSAVRGPAPTDLVDYFGGTAGADVYNGVGGNDWIYGAAGNDQLTGGLGDDNVFGGDGDDTLNGGGGSSDALRGGDGWDSYVHDDIAGALSVIYETDSSGDTESILLGSGVDVSEVDVTESDFGAGTPSHIGLQIKNGPALSGSHSSSVSIDNFFLLNNDWIVKFADGQQWTKADLIFKATHKVGTAADDYIPGANNLANDLQGGGGADYISGGRMDDVLDGGTGADSLSGGGGNDIYVVDNLGDQILYEYNLDIDTVRSSISWTLGNYLENLELMGATAINGTGNALANKLTGNTASNALDGKGGADLMVGGKGSETYVVDNVGDVVVENPGEGTDLVQSAVTYTLSANVENLTLTGSGTINGIGNSRNNIIVGNTSNNTLTGGAGNDTLDGGLGNDTLLGGTGNDTLNGAAGADIMVGGSGDDTYVVNGAADTVTEAAGEGTDSVQSSVAMTLGNQVENLTLTGTLPINGTGNLSDNVLAGNQTSNTLKGAEGNDTYDGAAGADTFTDTSLTSNDTYRWGTGSGLDNLTDSGGTLDHVDLFAGVTKSQLRFAQSGNSLVLTITGQTDKLTLNSWFVSPANQIEEFRLTDGSKVLASEVQSLLGAMAAFSAPTGESSTFGHRHDYPVRHGTYLVMPV